MKHQVWMTTAWRGGRTADLQLSPDGPLAVEDTEAWVLAPEDLILAKLEWTRISRSDRQITDVRALLNGVPDIDLEYLDSSAAELGLVELLEEARQ